MKLGERTKISQYFGADEQEVAELLAYNQNIFQQNDMNYPYLLR